MGMACLQRHIQAYVDAGKFPGAISMVQRRGKVVHFQTYGATWRRAHRSSATRSSASTP